MTILLICEQNSPLDCMLNFLALYIIAEIDNQYAKSIVDDPLYLKVKQIQLVKKPS